MNHSHWEHGGWNLDLCCGLRRLGFPARLGLGCPCSLFLGRDYRYFFPSPQEMQACWPWQMFSQRIHPPLCVSWTSVPTASSQMGFWSSPSGWSAGAVEPLVTCASSRTGWTKMQSQPGKPSGGSGPPAMWLATHGTHPRPLQIMSAPCDGVLVSQAHAQYHQLAGAEAWAAQNSQPPVLSLSATFFLFSLFPCTEVLEALMRSSKGIPSTGLSLCTPYSVYPGPGDSGHQSLRIALLLPQPWASCSLLHRVSRL